MNRGQRRASQQKRATVVNPTAWFGLIVANRETDSATADKASIKLHDAFAQLRGGTTDDEIFDRVACAMNLGLIRAEAIDILLEQTMLAGRDALMECDRIRGQHGRYGFTGPGLVAMRDALEAYEAILRASTPKQMRQALDVSIHRMRAGELVAPLPHIAATGLAA